MKIAPTIIFVCSIITALFGTIDNAIFLMVMAIFVQLGGKNE